MGGDTMKIEWMGHACFQISCGKERILIDPFDPDTETGGYLHGAVGGIYTIDSEKPDG